MNKQISILGCGWLGFPLAESLLQEGYTVFGATTSPSKLDLLQNSGIVPFQVEVTAEGVRGDIDSFLGGSAILILNIPPGRASGSDSFVSKIEHLLAVVETSSVKKILLVSSTSVYPDLNQSVTDDMEPQPDSESGMQLLKVEQLLQNSAHFQTTILRFGGLIGQQRHPVYHLAGRKNIPNPKAPINLIHLEDCIGIITAIIRGNIWGETFNAVTPYHPIRQEYYTQKARELHLELPEFASDKASIGKIITSDRISLVLGYTFAKNPL